MKWKIVFGLGVGMLLLASVMIYAYLLPNNIEIERYEVIPERPEDFVAFTREIWGGSYVDLCGLPEEYWKQPEFYTKGWETAKEKFYENPNYALWGVYGHGGIPREVGFDFENMREGDDFEFCSFFHNGFGIWTYQGFMLETKVTRDGEDASEYFDVEISPEEILLSPTFPVIEEGWTEKITYNIEAVKTPPKGTYLVELKVKAPSNSFSQQKTSEVLHMEIDYSEYLKDCIKFLGDEERCKTLIEGRHKKYVDGGTYQTAQSPLTIYMEVK